MKVEQSNFTYELLYMSWLRLSHYFEYQLTEGDITEATFKDFDDALSYLKPQPEK